jgi:hypothetical protein
VFRRRETIGKSPASWDVLVNNEGAGFFRIRIRERLKVVGCKAISVCLDENLAKR